MPEEKVSYHLILESSSREELPKGTIQVRLKFEHLNQLQQEHQQFVVTAGKARTLVDNACDRCNDVPEVFHTLNCPVSDSDVCVLVVQEFHRGFRSESVPFL